MNRYQYKFAIEKEIKKLNRTIDSKIVSGMRYRDDARRHKELLQQVRKMNQKKSIWPRAFQFLTLF